MTNNIKSAIDTKIKVLGYIGVKRFFNDYQLTQWGNPVITPENYQRRARAYMSAFILDGFAEPIATFLSYNG